MKIFYHPVKQKWYHNNRNTKITFGKNEMEIPFAFDEHKGIPFATNFKKGKVGPLIGILTSESTRHPFKGNSKTFERISKNVKRNGGIVVVFTPAHLFEHKLTGYTFIEEKQKWLKIKSPLPDVIYNRIPFRKDEKKLQHIFYELQNLEIPYFNSHFFNKWELYTKLSKDKTLQPFLPSSISLTSFHELKKMVIKHHSVYLKPAEGNKGTGIVVLSKKDTMFYLQTTTETFEYLSLEELWEKHAHQLMKRQYIIQEKIPISTVDNCPYDFRILAHFVKGQWEVSGIGVRVANQHSITTHVPKGGSIVPFQQLATDTDYLKIERLVRLVGNQLRSSYSNICEISVDVGKSKTGKFYLFEVNSKPMVFDERNIRLKGLQQLTSIFFELSCFE